MEKNKVTVVICGEQMDLKSTDSVEYVQRVANYVNDKMNDLLKKNPLGRLQERVWTVQVALSIADDYFRTQERFTEQQVDQEKHLMDVGRLQEEINRLNEKISELEHDIEKYTDPGKNNVVTLSHPPAKKIR